MQTIAGTAIGSPAMGSGRREMRKLRVKPTKATILALTACALLLASLPALAQDAPDNPAAQAQDVEMPREVRVLVQRGLAVLGFDPGPADGLFGPRTRAAIWDWQAAKELDTTGYLTLPEAEALAAVGAEASESLDVEFEEPAEREPDGTEAETATAPSGSRNQVLYFPTCGTDDAEPDGCWVALTSPAECVIWLPNDDADFSPWRYGTHTWSGECDDTSRASGRGTLNYEAEIENGSGWTDISSGEFVEGKQHGHWTGRVYASSGTQFRSEEGWVKGFQYDVHYVNSLPHGRMRTEYPDGTSNVREFRNGELVR